MKDLVMFHGTGCPHCNAMMPLVNKLEKELGISFDKKEIWSNEVNKEEFKSLRVLADKNCGGLLIPAFFNPNNNSMFCREKSYDDFKEWVIEQLKK